MCFILKQLKSALKTMKYHSELEEMQRRVHFHSNSFPLTSAFYGRRRKNTPSIEIDILLEDDEKYSSTLENEINDDILSISDEESITDFTEFHAGEVLIRLQRFCNVHELKLNDRMSFSRNVIFIIQKYLLPLSIVICLAVDPTGKQWYAYISVFVYYLHLHVLYEIFHNERQIIVAVARVTLFWAIFISIVTGIASATDNHTRNKNGLQANFLAALAGLLLFGIFIAVFDICWFFSNSPSKTRLSFFVVLINCCYFVGCLYMFDIAVATAGSLLIMIALLHCQIVSNQIIDNMMDEMQVDEYLDADVLDNFHSVFYWQSLIGTPLEPTNILLDIE